MLGLITAFKAEAWGILLDLKSQRKEVHGEIPFIRGHFSSGEEIVIGIGGAGAGRASETAKILIERYQPSSLFSIGTCGALSVDLETGYLIIPEKVQFLALQQENLFPEPEISVEKTLYEALTLARRRAGLPGESGLLLTSDRIVRTVEEKKALSDIHNAIAVDRESVAIARIATSQGVPFAVVRVVLDRAWDPLVIDYEKMLKGKREPSIGDVVTYLLLHPGQIGHFYRDFKRVFRASATLRAYFRVYDNQCSLYA